MGEVVAKPFVAGLAMHATIGLSVVFTLIMNDFNIIELFVALAWLGYGVPFISVVIGVITGLYSDSQMRDSNLIGFAQGLAGSFISMFIIPFLLGFIIGMFNPEFFGINENDNMGLKKGIESLFDVTIALIPLCFSAGICSMIGYCYISNLLDPESIQQSGISSTNEGSTSQSVSETQTTSQTQNPNITQSEVIKCPYCGYNNNRKRKSCKICLEPFV